MNIAKRKCLSLLLILSLVLGVAPSTVSKAYNIESSYIYEQSDLLSASITDTSVTVYADGFIQSLKNYGISTDTLLVACVYSVDGTYVNKIYYLEDGATDFTVSNLVGGNYYYIFIGTPNGFLSYDEKESASLIFACAGDNDAVYSSDIRFTNVGILVSDTTNSVEPTATAEPTATVEPIINEPTVTTEPIISDEPTSISYTPNIAKASFGGELAYLAVTNISEESYVDVKVEYLNSKGKYTTFKGFNCSPSWQTSGYYVSLSGLDKASIYRIKVRAYQYVNGSKIYSKYSSYKYFISEPVMNSSKVKKSIKANSVTLSWGKVTGAKKYIIYMSTSSDGKYTKVGETTKCSKKITKYKGKKLKLTNAKKYIHIVAVGKANGKTIKSNTLSTYYVERRIY